MSDSSTSSSGISFTGLLQVAFIVLKLCKVIAWSWWWVLSPTFIGVGIAALLLAGIGICNFIEQRRHKKIVDSRGQLKSRWRERLEQIQKEQRQKQKHGM